MYKWIIILLAVMVATNPVLAVLAKYGVTYEHIVASFIALLATPWVVAQFDN